MIGISKLILENFQSHKYTVLDFTKGLNSIVGPTDSGKTAIFRAIKWALYNEPQGDYFVREGENETSVTLYFTNGIRVKRYRKKSKNGYELTYPDNQNLVFEGFGNKVPEEIVEATGIRKISLTPSEDRSLNMAEQLDGPFLLSETPALKASAIGKLVDADVIDYALVELNADLRTKNRDLKNEEEALDQIGKELETYEYLVDLELIIDKVDNIRDIIKDKDLRLKDLEAYSRNLGPIRDDKKLMEENLEKLKIIDILEKKYNKLTNIYNRKNLLEKISKRILENNKNIDLFSNLLSTMRFLPKAEDNYLKSLDILNRLKKLEDKSIDYRDLRSRINKIIFISEKLAGINELEEIEGNLTEKIFTYNSLLKKSGELNTLNQRLVKGQTYIKNYKGIDKAEAINKLCQEKIVKLKNLEIVYKAYLQIKEKVDGTNKRLEEYDKDLERVLKDYKDLLSEIKVCPTCFQQIDKPEEIIKHIIDEV